MSRAAAALALLVALAPLAAPAAPALAATPRAGVITLDVDARDVAHRIFRVRQRVPVEPGPLTLLYPEWIPGRHAPAGPIDKLAGLEVRAGDVVLPWRRSADDVYAFRVEVPDGVDMLELRFQYVSPQDPAQGRVVMTPALLNAQWDALSLYPAGYRARDITVRAAITLPAGWAQATALEAVARRGDTVEFAPVSYATLVDSPLFAGPHHRRVDLDPGARRPVFLELFADAPEELEATPEQIEVHRELVRQTDKLYGGARHFDRYHMLLAISDRLGGIGLEHHRSSENGVRRGYFTAWDTRWTGRDLLAHEYNHSWNGKYRRGAALATPHFNVPMGTDLMWVYEGQTQFYGNVLAARAGLVSPEQARDQLALVAALYARARPGLRWRGLEDTTNDPVIARRAPLPWRNWQLSEDYYHGGQLLWLAVDGKLRALSGGRRSLDDFARLFFGMEDGVWTVNTYRFADIVAALDTIAPLDWAAFLHQRLEGDLDVAGALASHGWRLAWDAEPSAAVRAREAWKDSALLMFGIGLEATGEGELRDVLWDGPAFRAGLAPGMTLVAVNGRAWSSAAIKDAIRAAAAEGAAPIRLLVKDFDRYRTLEVNYRGGLRYPRLERIRGRHDTLRKLHAPR